MIYNRRRYGLLEGSDFIIRSETGSSAFRLQDKFVKQFKEITPQGTRILNEGLGTLHAAQELLHKRNYRGSD